MSAISTVEILFLYALLSLQQYYCLMFLVLLNIRTVLRLFLILFLILLECLFQASLYTEATALAC